MKLSELWKHKRKMPRWAWLGLKYKLKKGTTHLASEIAYWEMELPKYLDFTPQTSLEFVPAFYQLKDEFPDEKIRILEVGPGPLSRLRVGYEKGMYDLIAVDPLANEYKQLSNHCSFIVDGTGEKMDKQFLEESFHMVYASNSLDHVQDPEKVFRNMVYLTKQGGIIIVCGNVKEGSRTNWKGLHKHDLWLEDNVLMLHTRGEKSVCLLANGLHPIRIIRDTASLVPWFSVTYKRFKNVA